MVYLTQFCQVNFVKCAFYLHVILFEGVCVRSLVTDYRKAFDLIDHNILYANLQGKGPKPSILNWTSDFSRGSLHCYRA